MNQCRLINVFHIRQSVIFDVKLCDLESPDIPETPLMGRKE